jgi:hypothetical protein
MEPPPGERFEVDWGHSVALGHAGDKRKAYAFALVEAHSQHAPPEFTHSQTFETFVRCFHVHASPPRWAWHARLPMTIWRPLSPSTMAGWSRFFRAFSPSPANTAFIRKPAMWRQVG